MYRLEGFLIKVPLVASDRSAIETSLSEKENLLVHKAKNDTRYPR